MSKDLVLSPNVLPQEVNINKIKDYDTVKNISELQEYIFDTPRVYDRMFIDEAAVPFNTTSLHVLYNSITNGFLKINEGITYITNKGRNIVEEPLKTIFTNFEVEIVTIRELNSGLVTGVINGTQQAIEDITYTEIHKVKIKDYIAQNGNVILNNKEDKVVNENLLNTNIQKQIETTKAKKTNVYIVAIDKFAAALYAVIAYNNLIVNNRVFMCEFSSSNYLSDLAIKLGLKNYSFDYKNISDSKSLLLLSKNKVNFNFSALADYVYNITNFDMYMRIVDYREITYLTHNIFFALVPTAESMSKVLTYINTYKPNRINLILVYKGFVAINEFTPTQVLNIVESKTNIKVTLESFIVKGGK